MVLQLFSQSFLAVYKPKQYLLLTEEQTNRIWHHRSIRCISNSNSKAIKLNSQPAYQPAIWSHDFIESLDPNCPINCNEKMKELEMKVMTLNIDHADASCFSSLQLLEFIDDIQRLGLGYRFQNDIRRALHNIVYTNRLQEKGDHVYSLHAVSLRFRLLRQHGYNVSQDVFRRFMDGHGAFKKCLQTDAKGLISLYQASYLAFEGEGDLHEAKLFATRRLLQFRDQENEEGVQEDVSNSLEELPLYRRMQRLQARSYIDAYRKRKDANLLLLELAMLDFNLHQSEFKTELQQVARWWKDIGLANKLSFARDRLMECFFWTVGVVSEPQYHSCRVELTKICTLITVIDDIYDVYGSLDELKIFTDAVKRWDIKAVKNMPEYLELGFLTLYNTINEMGSNTTSSAQLGEDCIKPTLIKVWGELCEAFFVEAKWTHSKSIPTLEDYLENAWLSISGVVILTHGYFLINQDIEKDTALEPVEKFDDLLKWSSMIFRLCNDLATFSDEIERGKTANAVSCCMREKRVCEEVAREYIKTLIDEAWRKLMTYQMACSQDSFTDMAINLARISHCTYQYGDGHGAPDARAKDRVLSVIIEPVTI